MRLDHDRAARGQRRGSVAAGHGERQREVAGAEHCYRTDGDALHAQVGARRGALGQGGVEGGLLPAAFAQHGGEQAQLAGGAAALALQARDRQRAFQVGAFDQRVAERLDAGGDGFEQGRALLWRGVAVGVESGFGQRTGALDLGLAAAMEVRAQGFAGGGIDGLQQGFGAAHGLRADQHVAGDVHGRIPCQRLERERRPEGKCPAAGLSICNARAACLPLTAGRAC
ncbi:hypothetical protein D3C72_1572940 [compost metagenome]